jgi:homoserine O-acetyltransferase
MTLEPQPLSSVPNYELNGPRNAPIVVVLGGISATRHVASSAWDPYPGWWEDVVGPEKAIDTNRFRVLSFDWIDGGRGPEGRPRHQITTHDQADALAEVLDIVGVPVVHAIVGASYGGMVALAFAERYGARVARLVTIGAAHDSTPMSTGLRALQRRIVELGIDTGQAERGMALARAVAMTTYRTEYEFRTRFENTPEPQRDRGIVFPVERYLMTNGERFAARVSPERFLSLSLSTDLHRVDPGAITVPTTIVIEEGDALVPEAQARALAERLGGPHEVVFMPTIVGHDAFLAEPDKIGPIIRSALFDRVQA